MKVERAYATLELQFPATRDEVKKAFHRLAHIHHPDKGGDVEKFKIMNAAYQFLIQRGYWDALASEQTAVNNKANASSSAGSGSSWRSGNFMYDESTRRYCVLDDDGNVQRSWSKDPDEATLDGLSWRDLDHSVEFKDYNGHLTGGHKRIS